MRKRNLILRISALVISLVLIAAMALCMTSCGKDDTSSTGSASQTEVKDSGETKEAQEAHGAGETKEAQEANEAGEATETADPDEGKTAFTFTVKYEDGKAESEVIKTDKKTVGEALLDKGLISGSDSEYGLMVDTVKGVRADYNKDKAYWAFYIDGDYANTGVSSTDVKDGAEYSFVYTPA